MQKNMKHDPDFAAAEKTAKSAESSAVAADQLQALVERIETLEGEKADIGDDIKAVYAEAKANGFDPKTIRKVIALRKKSAEERQEEEAMLDLYLHALGMAPEPSS